MVVNAGDFAFGLAETDVVKALEAGALDGADAVVGNEEPFLPTHEDVGLGPPAEVCRVFGSGFVGIGIGIDIDVRIGLDGVYD